MQNFSDSETLVSKHHAELSDAELDVAELNDAETSNSRQSLELIELGNNDFTFRKFPD